MKVILLVAGLLLTALGFSAQGDGIHVRREIIFPTGFDADVTTIGGGEGADRRVVTVTPRGFQTRTIGVSLEPFVAGATMHVLKRYDLTTYLLRLQDGRQFRVQTGKDVTIDGRPYRAVGWQDDAYTLISLDRRLWLRFSKAPEFRYN